MSALPVVISQQALRDLAEIEAFTPQNWGFDQATEYVDAIFRPWTRWAVIQN